MICDRKVEDRLRRSAMPPVLTISPRRLAVGQWLSLQPAELAAYFSPQRKLWVRERGKEARGCGRHKSHVEINVYVARYAGFYQRGC